MGENLTPYEKVMIEQQINENRNFLDAHIEALQVTGISNEEIEELVEPMRKSHRELEDYYNTHI